MSEDKKTVVVPKPGQANDGKPGRFSNGDKNENGRSGTTSEQVIRPKKP